MPLPPNSLPQQTPDPVVEKIANALSARGWRRRRGVDSRSKLRGSCLFHDDDTPSADFYPDDGWYYCHGCGSSYELGEVADALDLPLTAEPEETQTKMSQHEAGSSAQSHSARESEFHYHTRFGFPTAVYTYKFLTGKTSHYKLRFDLGGGKKTFAIQSPDGKWSKPPSFWPVYGDHQLPRRLNIVVVEGEKAQQRVSAATHLHQGVLISALTCGSAVDLRDPDNRKTLADRLQVLNPSRVLVWPDNDKPGQEWAKPLYQHLLAAGIPVAMVDVRSLPVEHAEGCDDFIDAGGSLDEIFQKEFQQVGGFTVDEIVDNVVVTKTDQFLLPASRRLYPIQGDNIELLFFRVTQQSTPSAKIVKRLQVELRSKSVDAGVEVYYRRWHDQGRTCLAWRGIDAGFAYYVTAEGCSVIQDPPASLLLLPTSVPRYSCKVNESGTRQDLEELCQLFQINTVDTTFIEGWLMCALLGLQTPILLLRGEAGSGKTTLARALVAVIEPTVPTITLRTGQNGRQADERALIEGLRQSTAILLDNVSGLAPDAEDLLCQFVTGFGVIHRQLYENKVENLAMQRAIVLTTTNWNVSKGDLSSRLVAIRMRAMERFDSDEHLDSQIQPLIEKVRGYLLRTASLYYRNTTDSPNGFSSIRIAGIGKVFRALRYDSPMLEARLTHMRGLVASETDSWFQAVVGWYQELGLKAGQSCEVKFEEIKGAIEGLSDQFMPSNQKFVSFVNEAAPRFRDFGFTMSKMRRNTGRFWMVTCQHEIAEDDDGDD